MNKISTAQIRKIHALKKELGYDEETLYAEIWHCVKSESISQLTIRQGVEVIDALSQKSYQKKPQEKLDHREGMASTKQLKYINGLAKQLGWQDEPERLRGFIKKYAKVDAPRFLTKRKASSVIEGLKKVVWHEGQKNEENRAT